MIPSCVDVISVFILFLTPCDCRSLLMYLQTPRFRNLPALITKIWFCFVLRTFPLPTCCPMCKMSFSLPLSCPVCKMKKKNSTYNVLPSVQDKTSILQHCLFPVFGSQGIRNRTYFRNGIPTVPANATSFGQIGHYLAFFGSNSRYVLLCCTYL